MRHPNACSTGIVLITPTSPFRAQKRYRYEETCCASSVARYPGDDVPQAPALADCARHVIAAARQPWPLTGDSSSQPRESSTHADIILLLVRCCAMLSVRFRLAVFHDHCLEFAAATNLQPQLAYVATRNTLIVHNKPSVQIIQI